MSTKRLLLIDGNDLLQQAYTSMGVSSVRTVNQSASALYPETQHGIFSFIGGMLKLLRSVKPTHVMVFFDLSRDVMSAGTRPLQEALPKLCAALTQLGIRYSEARDSGLAAEQIAGYAMHYNYFLPISIASSDNCYLQLVNEKIQTIRFHGDKLITLNSAYVRTRFHVAPHQYPDFRILTGDEPGFPAACSPLSAKLAAQLLNKYGSLDNLLAHLDRVRNPQMRVQIRQCADAQDARGPLLQRCITVTLPYPLTDLPYQHREITTSAVMEGIGIPPLR